MSNFTDFVFSGFNGSLESQNDTDTETQNVIDALIQNMTDADIQNVMDAGSETQNVMSSGSITQNLMSSEGVTQNLMYGGTQNVMGTGTQNLMYGGTQNLMYGGTQTQMYGGTQNMMDTQNFMSTGSEIHNLMSTGTQNVMYSGSGTQTMMYTGTQNVFNAGSGTQNAMDTGSRTQNMMYTGPQNMMYGGTQNVMYTGMNTGTRNVMDTGSGTQNVMDTGTKNVMDTGTQNVMDTGAQNVMDTGTQNMKDTGTQNVMGIGTQNVKDTGIQNVKNTGTQNVLLAEKQDLTDVRPQPSTSSQGNGIRLTEAHVENSTRSVENSEGMARNPFHVDTSMLNAVPVNEQASELQDLGLKVFNQEDFEEGVMAQMDEALAAEEQERLKKMLEKQLKTVQDDVRTTKVEIAHIDKMAGQLTPQAQYNKEFRRKLDAVKRQKENKMKQLKKLRAKQKSLKKKISGDKECGDEEDEEDGNLALEEALGLSHGREETDTERMIRLGEMTPFGTVVNKPKPAISLPDGPTDFEKYLMDQGKKAVGAKKAKIKKALSTPTKTISDSTDSSKDGVPSKKKSKLKKSSTDPFSPSNKEKVKRPNQFDAKDKRTYWSAQEADFSKKRPWRKRLHARLGHNFSEDRALSDCDEDYDNEGYMMPEEEYVPPADSMLDEDEQHGQFNIKDIPKKNHKKQKSGDDPDWNAGSEDNDCDIETIKAKYTGRRKSPSHSLPKVHGRDDGDRNAHENRIRSLRKAELLRKKEKIEAGEAESSESEDEEACFDGGLKVPNKIWKKLYRYQKTGVKWLWELHCQQAGGIVGDEMGLGKTIQIISFLAALRNSKLRDKGINTKYIGLGPTIIITPTTVMHQWVKEFHTWWPAFRVAVLHSSGSYKGSEANLVHSIVRDNGILITAFSGAVIYQDILLEYDWHYVILDEGHKIRNPDAQVTLACKQFRTCHRVILSGSPVQNNLKELWSLFDFVFPGKLGTLPDFMAHFSVPIVQGGYSNASDVQVQTAYKCACVLRDTINPYLLRRMKADVKNNLNLPAKNEQVLFCRLSEEQKDVYKEYLGSKECNMILSGNFMVFPGLITLRKVCNHPDISTGGPKVFDSSNLDGRLDQERQYGYWKRSGKMIVVASLLKLWKKQGHRVLLFSQSRQMLEIMEIYLKSHDYTYLKMDGTTSIPSRQPLINKFNNDDSIFLFLLTTRVGGLGVNLIGANRVLIYDPDWNPSTDLQARERAWRIGQRKQVTVYRLLTTGTIEEKIYHRQIFKQFLTNRVLKDPKQRRFFKSNDLYELFTLKDDNPSDSTETGAIFAGTGSDVKVNPRPMKKTKSSGTSTSNKSNIFDEMAKAKEKQKELKLKSQEEDDEDQDDAEELGISTDRLKEMKELAKKLSEKLGNNKKDNNGSKSEDTNRVVDATPAEPQASTSKTSDKSSDQKHKDQKKKKKKKKKDAKFEGEKIKNLDKLSDYTPSKEEKEEEDMNSSNQDDYVLAKLLKKSGVHSAMQHDRIMMSSDPDYALVEGEAERVARESAHALKASRARCGAQLGVPTWTGQTGAAGAPPKPRFGQKKNSRLVVDPAKPSPPKSKNSKLQKSSSVVKPSQMFDGTVAGNRKTASTLSGASTPNTMSSTELLTKMRSRNNLILSNGTDTHANLDAGPPPDIDADQIELITDIRNHIAFGCALNGQATTQEILDVFKSRIPVNESAKFKAMLKQLCSFFRIDGIGTWRLRPEFR